MANPRIHFLGCNGWIPNRNRTCCYLVEYDDALIMLDAGSGAAGLMKMGEVLEGHDAINVILSHYHLDHTTGLSYMIDVCRDKIINIFGPGGAAYPDGAEHLLKTLFCEEFHSVPLDRFGKTVNVFSYEEGVFAVGGRRVETRPQVHTQPSFSVQIENDVMYATDCETHGIKFEDVSCDFLLHEAWTANGHKDGHSSLTEIIEHVPLRNFHHVAIIHQNPSWDDKDLRFIEKAARAHGIIVPCDGLILL